VYVYACVCVGGWDVWYGVCVWVCVCVGCVCVCVVFCVYVYVYGCVRVWGWDVWCGVCVCVCVCGAVYKLPLDQLERPRTNARTVWTLPTRLPVGGTSDLVCTVPTAEQNIPGLSKKNAVFICRLIDLCSTLIPPPPVGQRLYSGLGRLIVEVTRLHSSTPYSVGLPRTSHRPFAETSTSQHTTFTRDKISMHPGGFKPAIPASEQSQTHALDRAAIRIGPCSVHSHSKI